MGEAGTLPVERTDPPAGEGLSDECLRLALEVRSVSPIIRTLANQRPNELVEVSRAGILVHTEKSRRAGEAQLVPGWMVNVAWEHLRRTGLLDQEYLVSNDGLNVKRSAFIMALLARFPGVEVVSESPARLAFGASQHNPL